LECYVCGETVGGASKPFWRRKRESKAEPTKPVTPISNLLFMASLVLTGVSFLSSQKMPLPVSATLSGALLVARIVTDRKAAPRSSNRKSASSPANQVPPALLRRMTLG
jgi:hypothetical protein